ncbi:type I pullulanase [Bacillus sp. FSL W8-0445]|jgi:pullulanase|uniref:Pullulanase n=1 Tax=Bacillus licheniformis TaxID=1402 RepID=A0A5Q3BTH2_BACLI|nr:MULTISPECIES: type I pullulanase [Bacillus]MBJ7887696.1 type I pullulanase [Bacillaceae bacterium HSR45]AMR11631.1 type I pullulanase [Bacillus licheniformis]AOP16368.1 Pullulanase [Bacillus licheniformis]AUZ31811.1 type I pullulanase [Bacillus licheniformis]AWV41840.1 type I pullulanase [Bacillus licheniformis]
MPGISRPFEAYLDEMRTITVLVPKSRASSCSPPFLLEDDQGERIELSVKAQVELEEQFKYVLESSCTVPFGRVHKVCCEESVWTDLQIGSVTRSAAFDKAFFYDGRLGAFYSKGSTLFKVWAPTASAAAIKLEDPDSLQTNTFQMMRRKKGVFEVTVEGDLNGWSYLYELYVNGKPLLTVDPYAKAVTANGEKGVVLDPEEVKVEKHRAPRLHSPCDAVIYEVHIRDFSIHEDSGMRHKGKYVAFTEDGTETSGGFSTGIAYLKELGVTHIEVLPFHDFAGVDELSPDQSYNWGYNPLHFNAPEGSYSLDPQNPKCRITELKTMIQSLHKHGFSVIMDAVYNHVYKRETSPFEKTVPGYFFRHNEYGFPSDGTGVGNDIASERLMVRKYILDSVRYWLEEYDVDGIRFDLMGILDIETVRQISTLAENVKPGVLLFGEGWDLNTPLDSGQKATLQNAGKVPAVGFFNDRFRNAVKGSTFELSDRGYALGDTGKKAALQHGIAGSPGFLQPAQSINYVECHDNHTFWDKMALCFEEDADTKRLRQRLAVSIVLLSQGVPFLHAGQEFCRTKNGDSNSYRSGDDINKLDWEKRAELCEDVEYVRQLIRLRRSHPAFRLQKEEEVKEHLSFMDGTGEVTAYKLKNIAAIDPWNEIIVVHCPFAKKETLKLPDQKQYLLHCDPFTFFNGKVQAEKRLRLNGIGTYVLYEPKGIF